MFILPWILHLFTLRGEFLATMLLEKKKKKRLYCTLRTKAKALTCIKHYNKSITEFNYTMAFFYSIEISSSNMYKVVGSAMDSSKW